jgi:hypothetical protein|tara:strand:+ start:7234 stop:8016 length:783 start_codon:yes stop_codon:yes gene_type:complete
MSYFNRKEVVNSVYQTKELDIFNIIKGNRPPNPQHVRRLADSIQKNGMMQNPIIINESFDVIDGQHRLLAAKIAGSVIYYIILPGYGLKEVQELNINQKNWTKRDFMESYANMGIESYSKLKSFMITNPEFTINNCIAMCSNRATFNGIANKYIPNTDKVKDLSEVFEDGTWLGKDFYLAQENANKILLLKPHYDGYNRSIFVSTMLSLFNNENFDFFEFANKLTYQTQKLEDCASVAQYKVLIEKIYNHRRRNKVNLRF